MTNRPPDTVCWSCDARYQGICCPICKCWSDPWREYKECPREYEREDDRALLMTEDERLDDPRHGQAESINRETTGRR